MNEIEMLAALMDGRHPTVQKAADIRRAVLDRGTIVLYGEAFARTKAIFDHAFAVCDRFLPDWYRKGTKAG
jgi:hypothetical protein